MTKHYKFNTYTKDVAPPTHKVVLVSWGGTKKLFEDELNYESAVKVCEMYGWQWQSPDGGYIWDMEIEEM